MDYNINQLNELLTHIQRLNEEIEISDSIIDELLEEIGLSDVEDLTEEEKKKWIQKAIEKEGSLRKSMKAKKGKNIPEKKLEAAAKKGGKTGKRARLALTLKKMREKKEEKKDLKEALDLAAMHANLSDNVRTNGKSMKKEDLNSQLMKIAQIENQLGPKAKVGYSPWLTIEGTY